MRYSRLLLSLCSLAFALPAISQQPQSPLVDSFETYQRMKRETVFGMHWIGIGPVVNSARVESVQLDPANPGTMYVAFGSGNLWKTINNGVTWQPLFEDQASHGIGDIALAPSNPNIIYLGTGESLKKARNFTIPGTGVYRSDDGGQTWRHLGLSDSWHIGEIAVHPRNPDVVVVAVLGHFWSSNSNRGLYRTENGGETWHHVLKIDENTGANDVVWAQDNPDVAYASMWENHPGVCGANSSVYKSIDGGVSWQKCGLGLPTGDQVGRIGLAVSHSDSDKVYALIDNRDKIKSGAAQVFQSLDGGKNWKRTHQSDLKFFSRIGWYFADIYVDPTDDDEIYALGVRVAHSKDGGQSFEFLSGKVAHVTPSSASGLHLDHCELWINPTNPNHIVLGNDGGLYQSHDKGATWVHFNNLPTGEFYDIAIDQRSPYRIYGGTQDNATVFGPAKELHSSGSEEWEYLWIDPWNGGDGCLTKVDPSDSNTVYFSAQEGAFRRKNMATNRSTNIRPQLPEGMAGELKFNFVAPMIISPHDPKTLYLAGNYVFQSTNQGDDWNVISPDIAITKDQRRRSLAAASIAESPMKSGLIYVGTDKGALWVSEDGGGKWIERSQPLPIGYVRSIYPSRFAESRAYIAVTGLNYDDFSNHLFCTEDRGVTWDSISANLPNEPANVIIEDPIHEDILYAGSFRGVYVSMDRGQSWSMLGKNLPACSISDLAIHEREKDLIVATHGRGIYKLNLKPLYEFHLNKLSSGGNDYLFPVPPAKRPYLSDVRPGLNFRNFEKTPITFWVRSGGEVKLSVLKVMENDGEEESDQDQQSKTERSAADSVMASFDVSADRGLNQFRWDQVLKRTTSAEPYFINYKTFIPIGNYRVRLKTPDGDVLEREFKVLNVPNKQ